MTRWWFVIHDSEEVLADIDNKWNQLKLQVAWELEHCFAPQKESEPACSEPNALDSHQNSPETYMQSQPQAGKLPVMSEKHHQSGKQCMH